MYYDYDTYGLYTNKVKVKSLQANICIVVSGRHHKIIKCLRYYHEINHNGTGPILAVSLFCQYLCLGARQIPLWFIT